MGSLPEGVLVAARRIHQALTSFADLQGHLIRGWHWTSREDLSVALARLDEGRATLKEVEEARMA